jgi:ATP-dependent exoDNAse (exonuclease V) beta subunit
MQWCVNQWRRPSAIFVHAVLNQQRFHFIEASKPRAHRNPITQAPRTALGFEAAALARCDLARHVLQWQQSPERARLRLANLERLAELAAEYEDACRSTREAATISGLLLWLQDLAATSADTMPQRAVHAVQVMTHHAAKGLEWPMVVLVDLASNVKNSIWDAVRAEHQGAFDAQQPLNNRFLRYWPWPYGSQCKVPVADVVEGSLAALLGQLAAVRQWLHTRWPKAELVVEVPITQSLAGGQLMNGRIDLLLKTDQGWILFDHKSGSQNST